MIVPRYNTIVCLYIFGVRTCKFKEYIYLELAYHFAQHQYWNELIGLLQAMETKNPYKMPPKK